MLTVLGAGVVAASIVGAMTPLAWAQDTCRQGFVWREAFPGDHVCVPGQTQEVRS